MLLTPRTLTWVLNMLTRTPICLLFIMTFVLVLSKPAMAEIKIITEDLNYPWSLAFLPDGDYLVTERDGELHRVSKVGEVSAPITGLPEIAAVGQGGLFDVTLHPNFAQNNTLYISYATGSRMQGYNTAIMRAVLDGNTLIEQTPIFTAEPMVRGGRHFGGRLLFDNAGYLFISLGDRGDRFEAQNPANHIGSVIRLNDDGTVPADNPFVGKAGFKPEIYSYGHRNIQGMSLHPITGEVWTHEHGPQGGDEINLVEAGKNYGWPAISYGGEYGSGRPVGKESLPGLEQPLHYWNPSIAPSGMAFLDGDNVLVGALKYQLLARLRLDGNTIGEETRHHQGEWGRIRDVRVNDGLVYLLTDDNRGRLIQLSGEAILP